MKFLLGGEIMQIHCNLEYLMMGLNTDIKRLKLKNIWEADKKEIVKDLQRAIDVISCYNSELQQHQRKCNDCCYLTKDKNYCSYWESSCRDSNSDWCYKFKAGDNNA